MRVQGCCYKPFGAYTLGVRAVFIVRELVHIGQLTLKRMHNYGRGIKTKPRSGDLGVWFSWTASPQFADDVVLVSSSNHTLRCILECFTAVRDEVRMHIGSILWSYSSVRVRGIVKLTTA